MLEISISNLSYLLPGLILHIPFGRTSTVFIVPFLAQQNSLLSWWDTKCWDSKILYEVFIHCCKSLFGAGEEKMQLAHWSLISAVYDSSSWYTGHNDIIFHITVWHFTVSVNSPRKPLRRGCVCVLYISPIEQNIRYIISSVTHSCVSRYFT